MICFQNLPAESEIQSEMQLNAKTQNLYEILHANMKIY